jgi:O-antigen/teichoic acid export membrane protein
MFRKVIRRFKTAKVGQLSLKKAIIFSLTHYSHAVFSIICSALIARIYTKMDYGNYAYGMLHFTTISTLAMYGFDRTMVRDLVQKKMPNTIIRSSTLLIGAFGLLLALLSITQVALTESDPNIILIVSLFSMAGILMALSPVGWLDFRGQMQKQSEIVAIEKFCYLLLVLSIWFMRTSLVSITYLAIAFLILRVVFLAWEWYTASRTIEKAEVNYLEIIKDLIKSQFWVFATVLFTIMLTQINQFILKERGGLEQFTYFAISFQLINVIRILQRQILRLNINRIAVITENHRGSELINELKKMLKLSLISSAAIAIPCILLAPYLVRLVFGEKYLEATPTLQILFVWMMIYGAAMTLSQYSLGLKQESWSFKNAAIIGVISLIVAYFACEQYGAIGSALTLLIGHLAVILFQLQRVIKIGRQAV